MEEQSCMGEDWNVVRLAKQSQFFKPSITIISFFHLFVEGNEERERVINSVIKRGEWERVGEPGRRK